MRIEGDILYLNNNIFHALRRSFILFSRLFPLDTNSRVWKGLTD